MVKRANIFALFRKISVSAPICAYYLISADLPSHVDILVGHILKQLRQKSFFRRIRPGTHGIGTGSTGMCLCYC